MSLSSDAPRVAFTSIAREERTIVGTRRITSRVYLAPCFIVLAAVVLVVIGWISHWGGASFATTFTTLRVVAVGPATLLMVALFMIAERIWPAQKRSPIARGYRHDVLFTVFNATLTLPFVAALSLSFATVVRNRLPWLTFPKIAVLPHVLAVALIFVLMDGCNWAAHFANHRVEALWRFHEVHHSQEDMSVLTVFRTHPFIHIVYSVSLIPGIILIANGGLPTALLVVYAVIVALAHSNVRLSFGPLDAVFVSPNFHRVHHRLEGRQDVNLGFALSIWDHLFGTAVMSTRETVGQPTGLPGRPLAVEFSGDKPHHFSIFVKQLIAPFRSKGSPSTLSTSTCELRSDQ